MTRVVSQRQLHTSVCCAPSSQFPSFSLVCRTHTHSYTHMRVFCVCTADKMSACTVEVCVFWITCRRKWGAGGGGRLSLRHRGTPLGRMSLLVLLSQAAQRWWTLNHSAADSCWVGSHVCFPSLLHLPVSVLKTKQKNPTVWTR